VDPLGLSCPKYNTTEMDPYFKDWDERRGVSYLTPDERQAYAITARDGVLYDANGNRLDTSTLSSIHSGGAGAGIFVMDQDGNIYVGSHERGTFHHSSFLGGQPVAAAGEVVVVNGRLVSVTDKSGHYKPDVEYSNQVVHELQGRGVEVPDTAVQFGEW
jgi:hypothetical protein